MDGPEFLQAEDELVVPLLDRLRLSTWLTRKIVPPVFLLGHVVSTTSRGEIIGPTGLGKTNLGLAMATAIADCATTIVMAGWQQLGCPVCDCRGARQSANDN
jgi:hypothetical protein